MKTFLLLLTLVTQALALPNIIIIILADDLGYADTGFNNSKNAITPHLDRFVKSGVKLTDFRACPMCSPTRAGLLTGRWPLRFGMMRAVIPPWSEYGLPASANTLPELLARTGYERRGIIGKWHLGHSKKSHLPLAHGFTHFVGHYNGAIDYFTHEREEQLDWHKNDATLREDGYATDLLAKHAVEFINGSPIGKPYFLYLPFNAPYRGAKLNLYEGGTRVAAALRWPAHELIGGKSFADRIGYIDILPTVLQAAGVSLPKNIDGINFLPAILDNAPLPRRPWFSYMHQSKAALSSVHLGPWKLIVNGDAFNSNTLTLELYNLKDDSRETTNLSVKHPARAASMLAKIKKFGTLQVPGATPYGEGRKGFTAPKDWLIE